SRTRDNDEIDALERALRDREAELVANAARFRSLVENSSDMTLVVDETGKIGFVSPASRCVLGMDEAELEGTDVMDLVHPDEREHVAAALAVRQSLECRMRHADHTWRGVDVLVVDLRNDPTVAGLVLHIRDVTDRRRLEAELRHAQKLESIGQLASGVAHEINTPIQYVGNNLQFLLGAFEELKPMVSGDGAEALLAEIPVAIEEAMDGVERVARIVRAMKSFGHAGGDAMAPADINEAVRNAMAVAYTEVKHVAVVSLDLGDVPPVMCHIGDVNQVLLNLIVNAAHAVGDVTKRTRKKGRITVRTRVEGADCVIEVCDTGAGIPPNIADRIFEPFFTTKEVGVGTGQGLALAYSLIHDRHRGSISFESDPLTGTKFDVRIPLEAAA
ncbi:MAG TPA: ATP-binding protein, partial [Acidimicrobiales bacterium]|nr:ATP-binding protein [Acidimicrobiales bacterium]